MVREAIFYMASYRSKILDMDKKCEWGYVYVCDMCHWAALSGKSIECDQLDIELYAQIFYPLTVRADDHIKTDDCTIKNR